MLRRPTVVRLPTKRRRRTLQTQAADGGGGPPSLGVGTAQRAPRPPPEDAAPPGGPLQEHHLSGGSIPASSFPSAPTDGPMTAASRRALWFAAVKPPMYSVGLVPVAVAAAAVGLLHGPGAAAAADALASAPSSLAPRALRLAAAAAAIIAWLNLSNDAFDASTGVDAAGMGKPESVVALTGGRALPVLLLSLAFLAAGVAALAAEVSRAAAAPGAAPAAAAMLAAAVACGYVYQGPPFRLSYKGLGEPLCFVAFGPLATAAFYLTLAPEGALAAAAAAAPAAAAWGVVGKGAAAAALAAVSAVPPAVWALAAVVGGSTTVILFCSHFHQTAGDRAVGKMSPLVRLGTERGVAVLRGAIAATYAAAAVGVAAGALPPVAVALAATVSLRAAARTVDFAARNHREPLLVAPLKRFATAWHISLGGGLAAGLAVAALAARRGAVGVV